MIVTWVAVAAAVALVPATKARGGGRGRAGRRVPGSGDRARRGWPPRAVAALAAGGAGVALFGTGPGAAAAAVLALLAWWAAGRSAGSGRRAAVPATLPLVLDLLAAALRAGQPLPAAIDHAVAAAEPLVALSLRRVAGLLRLGATPATAWGALPSGDPLEPVAAASARSAASGLRLASTLERLAAELRQETAAAAAARAQRAGTLTIAPLGACFLPAFVLLGVVPVVVGLMRGFAGWPNPG